MHCKPTLRRVKLFLEGIYTLEYTLFPPSNCPKIRDHLNGTRADLTTALLVPLPVGLLAFERTGSWVRSKGDPHPSPIYAVGYCRTHAVDRRRSISDIEGQL